MDYNPQMKEVYFDKYCPKCAHEKVAESENPCYECLKNGFNWDSHKPWNYVKKGQKTSKTGYTFEKRRPKSDKKG